jgi:hypothetical protein
MRFIFCLISATLALGIAAGSITPALAKPQTLAVVFADKQDGPRFSLDYRNDTHKAMDLTQLLEHSSIVLDGKEYPRGTLIFIGNARFLPGTVYSLTVEPREYRLGYDLQAGVKQDAFDPRRGIRAWTCPLKPGTHTILVKFGNKEFGPVTFVWATETPYFY